MYYLLLFYFMVIIALFTNTLRKESTKLFTFFFIILLLISLFRYGSGTDYFSYKFHYYTLPTDFRMMLDSNDHMEIGYNFFVFIFKKMNFSFEFFVGFVSLFVMIIFYRVIKINSDFEMGSILIFAANYYPIYVNSGIRQGIGLALLILAVFKYLKNKDFVKYIIIIIIASLFHMSAIIGLLFIPLTLLSKTKFNNSVINILLLMLSIVLYLLNFSSLLSIAIPDFAYSVDGTNILTIFLRLFFLMYLYLLFNKQINVSSFERSLIYIYYIGTLLFFAASNISILSRLLEYFTICEIIIIPNLIFREKRKQKRMAYFLLMSTVFSVLLIKDLSSFTRQQDYYKTGAMQYRYTTILHKEKIYEYKHRSHLDIFE